MGQEAFCGCCEAPSAATPLAIFNRPGLSSIAFRIGTFATFREALLEALSQDPRLAGLTSRESTDFAITLLELFAATGDVLSFYNERIANELFLRTARERDSLLRLTRLIGYRLRPGLAAQTRLSFALDVGAGARIRKGFKVMSVPGQDEQAQIFESLEQIDAHGDLNEAPAFAPPIPFNGLAPGSSGGPIIARPAMLAVGDRLIIFGRDNIEEKTVASLTTRGDGEALAFAPPVQRADWSGDTARICKSDGRLRFFGHNAPATVNVYVPAPSPTGWPSWQSKTVDASLADGTLSYPLDTRHTDLEAGAQLLIDAGAAAVPRLRTACIVKTEDRPATVGGIDQLSDTVTYVQLRQTITGVAAAGGDGLGGHVVFARSGSDRLLQLDPFGASPRRWNDMGLDAATSDIAVLAGGLARHDVLVRGGGFNLWQRVNTAGVWGGWVDHGGILTSAASVAAESGGQMLAFVRGTDMGLWGIDITSGASGSWFPLGGVLTSAPAAVSSDTGNFAIFVRGTDRALWFVAWDGTNWLPWTSLKGVLAGGPCATSTGGGRIDVAALDDSGALIHRRFDGTAWSDWLNLGGDLLGAITLVAGAPDRIDILARGRDSALRTISRSGSNWTDWQSLGGKLTSSPTAWRDAAGLHAYGRGADGAIASTDLTGSTSSAWASHGDGVGGLPDRRQTAIYRLAADDIVFRDYDYPPHITQGRLALRMPPGATTIGALGKGRRILLRSATGLAEAQVAAVTPVAAIAGEIADHLFVDFTPAPVAPLRDVTLLGNVTAASHGETQPVEALGHGDAGKSFQRFKLSRPGVSYLQTGTAIDGAAALEVRVNGELWKETPSFFGRRGNERVYTARQADDGSTLVTFGDGASGTRLPSGAMNVSATYRTGLGLKGLMRAGQLSIPLERPPGLRSVTNPLPADGAADPETRDNSREAAPNTVKTFGRAVSLADFAAVATASGLAAKAYATWVWSEFERAVHVTVAGPGGLKLSPASLALLRAGLDSSRDPNRPLLLDALVRVPIVVSARVLRNPEYQPDAVLQASRDALAKLFAFDAMSAGEAVFASQIYAALQGATSVTAVDIDVFQLKGYADLTPAEQAIRAVDAAPLQPHIRIFPARPTPPLAQIDRYARAGFDGPPPPVLAAEQAYIEDPASDITLTVVEAL